MGRQVIKESEEKKMKKLLILLVALFWLTFLAHAQVPVTITIELPADVAAHLESLRTSGQYVKPGEAPGGELMYATLQEFIRGEMLRVWLGPLLERFPTAAIKQRLAAIRKERDAIDTLKKGAVRRPGP